jgi:hypothetical protein
LIIYLNANFHSVQMLWGRLCLILCVCNCHFYSSPPYNIKYECEKYNVCTHISSINVYNVICYLVCWCTLEFNGLLAIMHRWFIYGKAFKIMCNTPIFYQLLMSNWKPGEQLQAPGVQYWPLWQCVVCSSIYTEYS